MPIDANCCWLEAILSCLPTTDHGTFAVERAYNAHDLRRVTADLVVSRERFVQFFGGLTEALWELGGVHPENGY